LRRCGRKGKRGLYATEEGSMPKQQKTSTKEFKLEAVRLVKSSEKPMSQIAREPRARGISGARHRPKRRAPAFPGGGHQTAQEEELRRLRRELEVTRH
jgi:transposase-like protein